MVNKISVYYLKPQSIQSLDHFSVELWFSLAVSQCLRRHRELTHRELYTERKLVLGDAGCSYCSETACDGSSGNHFLLEFEDTYGG